MTPARAFAVVALGLTAACTPTEPTASADEGSTGAADDTTTTTETSAGDESTGPVAPRCGDGVVDDDEECDDGDDGNAQTAACLLDCTAARCGDGFVQEGVEECDDGNDENGDGCTTMCIVLESCGDGVVQPPEECDDGPDNADNAACRTDCLPAFCGDGFVHEGVESCDDQNDENNDACTELCAPPECGDGFIQNVNGELCDDGDDMDGDECRSDCLGSGLWTRTYNGSSDSNDLGNAVSTDSAGNVIAVGTSFEGAQGDDVWVRKYDPDGDEVWTRGFHGITSDRGLGVATAGDDSLFVVGSSFSASDGRDIWIRHYTEAGAEDWTTTVNGSANDTDEAHAVAVAPNGDVVVAGYVTSNGTDQDAWVRRYTSAGATEWTRTFDGSGDDDVAYGVAVDSGGNVAVAGTQFVGGERSIWVRRYTSAGDVDWTRTHDGGIAGGDDQARDVAIDGADNIVVVGYVTTAAAGTDIFLRKYSSAGDEVWTQTHDGAGSESDFGQSVAVTGTGDIVVAGSIFAGAAHADNIFIRRYDADGQVVWTSTHNSEGSRSDVAGGVAVDGADNIAVAGNETRTDQGEARNVWVRRILQ